MVEFRYHAAEPIPRSWFCGLRRWTRPRRSPADRDGSRLHRRACDETIDITSAFSARVTIYLTVVTSVLSNVTMPRA